MRKYSYEFVKKVFESEGYQLLSTKYINSKSKLKYKCPKGHIYYITFDGWNKGRRCYFCNANIKLTSQYVRKELAKEGYQLLSEYKNSNTKFKYKCPNGHIGYIKWDHWRAGSRCAECAGNKNKLLADILVEFEAEDYELLSTNYKNSHSKLKYKCPNGHIGEIYYYNWKHGHRCAKCANNQKLSLYYIKDEIEKEGYGLLSSEYVNSRQKLSLLCPNNHKYVVSWSEWKSGSRCPICNGSGTSKQELELKEFLDSLGIIYIYRDRQLITPLELDFVIPEKKLAIEYCGLYWHSELAGKGKQYHLSKLEDCLTNNYKLLTIFEDEWLFKRRIVESILKYKLGITNTFTKLFARDCIIREVDTNTASTFCAANHLQGYVGSSVKLGLFYEDSLVAIMTFAKPSISKGYRVNDRNVWELSRFCTLTNYYIIGGASKLLKFFENNYEWSKIISYADRRWSVGNLYKVLGFKLEHFTEPNYWYFKHSDRIRHHRFSLRKTLNDNFEYSEWQNRMLEGWNRIWDCGNIKYCKYNR